MTDPMPAPELTATRLALQSVAEHLLSAARQRRDGHIGLRVTHGGFGTPVLDTPDGPWQLRVDGTDVVLLDSVGERRAPLSTLAAAAAFAGEELGAPTDIFTPTTPGEPGATLVVDPGAARKLAEWYALVDRALDLFGRDVDSESPPLVQLWPEHFDLALSVDEVNYGGSPGDVDNPEPYLYIGPWTVPAGAFWNASFGATRPAATVSSAEVALAFFREGRAAAA